MVIDDWEATINNFIIKNHICMFFILSTIKDALSVCFDQNFLQFTFQRSEKVDKSLGKTSFFFELSAASLIL